MVCYFHFVDDRILLAPSLQKVYAVPTKKPPTSVIRGTRMSKINRNDPCPCGSGKKYKKCCGLKEQQARKPRLSNPISVLSQISGDKGSPVDLARRVFNWFASVQADEIDIEAVKSGLVAWQRLAELSEMVGDNKLSSTGAKEIFLMLFDENYRGKSPEDIAKERNLLQVSDEGAIATIVDEVLNDPASAASIADIKAGKDKAVGFLVGQVMKKSKGKANPALAQKLIREKL